MKLDVDMKRNHNILSRCNDLQVPVVLRKYGKSIDKEMKQIHRWFGHMDTAVSS